MQYFVDKCLPFGSSISCSHFQRVSNGLKHLIQYHVGWKGFLTNYLDDFLFLAWLLSECNKLLQLFIDLCKEIGFPLSMDKTEWASLRIVFLGILLNGCTFTLSIPLDKRVKAQSLIEKFLSKKKATVQELQQLCGYLNFLAKAIFPGHTFICRMYSKYTTIVNKLGKYDQSSLSVRTNQKVLKSHNHVKLDREFKLDCEVWHSFLKLEFATVVNRPMIDLAAEPVSAVELQYFSDASANPELGFGCVIGNKSWIWGKWESGFIHKYQPSIEYLELFALCAGIFTWEYDLKNLRMKVHCDNQDSSGYD